MSLRIGIGYDSHRFARDEDGGEGVGYTLAPTPSPPSSSNRPLILGGIVIPDHPGLIGHSDGDAIAHAITDAILGAAAAGNIGSLFPDTDPANKNRDSIQMLQAAVERIKTKGFKVQQVDVTVITESPKIGPHIENMTAVLSKALGVTSADISIKGKTNEGMGWIGCGEGLACIAVATINYEPRPD